MTVDLNFVGDGAWGTGLTRRLTRAELNANFYALKLAVEAIDTTAGVSVVDIVVTGRRVTFYLSDDTTKGPFTLPVAKMRWRGEWEALTAYAELDLVTVGNSGIYLVLEDHVSDGSFDPDRSNSNGNFYQLVFAGNVPQAGESFNETYTPTASDLGRFINMKATAGCVVTLPSDASNGDEYHFRQGAAGAVSFISASDAPIEGMLGFDNMTGGVGSVVTAKFYGGSWFLFGRLAASSA